MRRAMNIFMLAVLGIYSPSLNRYVRISDIWKTPQYLGAGVIGTHRKYRKSRGQ